jgi:hypothetical protein
MNTKTVSIQERMRNKAIDALDEVEYQIDSLMDKGQNPFSMYKYLRQLGFSSKVVKYMSGFTQEMQFELKNEEGCEQLDEAYNFLTKAQKKKVIKKLEEIEKDIDKYCEEYKPVRKPRIKTPAQQVKKLPYLAEWKKYKSINPEEIIRASMLFAYNTSNKKLTMFKSYGGLRVQGSKILDADECIEKTLTDLKLLDRLVSGGNIIASKFMDEIPRSKEKEGNNRITKNALLIKVIR